MHRWVLARPIFVSPPGQFADLPGVCRAIKDGARVALKVLGRVGWAVLCDPMFKCCGVHEPFDCSPVCSSYFTAIGVQVMFIL